MEAVSALVGCIDMYNGDMLDVNRAVEVNVAMTLFLS